MVIFIADVNVEKENDEHVEEENDEHVEEENDEHVEEENEEYVEEANDEDVFHRKCSWLWRLRFQNSCGEISLAKLIYFPH